MSRAACLKKDEVGFLELTPPEFPIIFLNNYVENGEDRCVSAFIFTHICSASLFLILSLSLYFDLNLAKRHA